jgi:tetratricopeptide (TPR) repeat protein
VALVAGFLVLALAGQAGADALTDASGDDTGRAVERAASSYLTGLKVVAAAALWNRADPIMHRYYHHEPLATQRYLVTSINIVQTLDPHMIQSYYAGSWILIRNERVAEGLEMAERGIEANPKAGILWVNVAQLRQLYGNDDDGAVEAGRMVLENEMEWTDAVEQHNAYAILGAIFRQAGRTDLDEIVQSELVRLDEVVGDALPAEAHDHDGDGTPDH